METTIALLMAAALLAGIVIGATIGATKTMQEYLHHIEANNQLNTQHHEED